MVNGEREPMYFEPRVVGFTGSIRWYGSPYTDNALACYMNHTVYIRDDSRNLYIYKMIQDEPCGAGIRDIKTTFVLITVIKKDSDKYRYGKRIR